MKKILLMLMIVTSFVACKKEKLMETSPELNEFVNIHPDESFYLKSAIKGLTPAEIVEQSAGMAYTSHYRDNQYFEEAISSTRGTFDYQKDYENSIIRMGSQDIIMQMEGYEGDLKEDFLSAWDVYFTNEAGDTIAYIPNEQLREIEPLIREAYDNNNIEEINKLFEEAYTYKAIE